ncbi:hypothetical protein [Rhizorhapis suberifaciens]|uniref:Uncharacterized protein n=1 Tax=Rhizorhapis suberifaciens TaxID=13656 RepID=A0A840HQ17_9SPHN|nr:hypothetical protein [Rhizorhapis suberifaciens]MBB4639811.1 hypothetical protein [Rhizorhapis suberifaciens]
MGHIGMRSTTGREASAELVSALRHRAESLPPPEEAWLWFEQTRAVTPIGSERPVGAPETYPFGL